MNIRYSKRIKRTSFCLAFLIFFSSCASTTLLESTPSGAKVYLNGVSVGETPYQHRDTKIVGSTTSLKLEKEGYETLNTSFSRDEKADVGAIIGGIFVLVPFLWTMKYNPSHSYVLVPLDPQTSSSVNSDITDSKAQKLRELKKLLDDKIITQEEFEIEKKKILEGEGK
ncbi:PEGA domain-containing protein [Maribellus sp. YY47]|uniref:PEGA domain-containing protein n=1 Tax=Maribellus sp. YY47 TaxID=2929486 RepID=UPI00200096A5|nr:PEGA domain-containing protein [Maribellus sp. YY47]MCK3686385.1 PEGA domain-containing protein [Maribellus sp. YY47]